MISMPPLIQFEYIQIEFCLRSELFNLNAFKLNGSNQMSSNIRIKGRAVGYSMDTPPQSDSDNSSEDGMLVLASRDGLEEACDDVEVEVTTTTTLRDSIICPRYDPCVLRYGKITALSS